MNSNEMATALKLTHGLEKATSIAVGLAKTSKDLLSQEAPGLGKEILAQEYEDKGQRKTKFAVNEKLKASRLNKTLRFWMNVAAILSKEEAKVQAAKSAKKS
jgi:hypothetical protein